jgi:hypothetical protein
MPAQLQAEFSPLHGYMRGEQAPVLPDDADLTQAVAAIRGRRLELLALARGEAAVATGRWYALARISRDLHSTLQELAHWDRDTQPLEEYLEQCRTPRQQPAPAPDRRS